MNLSNQDLQHPYQKSSSLNFLKHMEVLHDSSDNPDNPKIAQNPQCPVHALLGAFLHSVSLALDTFNFHFYEPNFSLMRLQSPLPTNSSAKFKISWIRVNTSLFPAQCFLTISASTLLRRLFRTTAATTTSSI